MSQQAEALGVGRFEEGLEVGRDVGCGDVGCGFGEAVDQFNQAFR